MFVLFLLKKSAERDDDVRKFFLLVFGIATLSMGKPEQIKTTKITIRNIKHIHFSYDILHMSGGANSNRDQCDDFTTAPSNVGFSHPGAGSTTKLVSPQGGDSSFSKRGGETFSGTDIPVLTHIIITTTLFSTNNR